MLLLFEGTCVIQTFWNLNYTSSVCMCVLLTSTVSIQTTTKKNCCFCWFSLIWLEIVFKIHSHTHSDFLNKSRFQFFWMTFFHHYPFSIRTTYNNNNKDLIFGHLMSINNCDRQREKEKKSTIQMIMCVFVGG